MTEIIILVVIVVLGFYLVGIYNKLVSLRNRFKNAFAQIDVQLKRRYELIPNLVETAKSYMKHERDTLEAVTKARNQAASAQNSAAKHPEDAQAIQSLLGAEAALGGSLGKLFALMENYPDLKANQTMQQLMEELTSTENRVAFARQAYNDGVTEYNIYREQFPNTVVANNFGFKEAQLFIVESAEERQAVKVSFG